MLRATQQVALIFLWTSHDRKAWVTRHDNASGVLHGINLKIAPTSAEPPCSVMP